MVISKILYNQYYMVYDNVFNRLLILDTAKVYQTIGEHRVVLYIKHNTSRK